MADYEGVRVEGLKELRAALRQAGIDAGDMPDLMHSIGMLVIRAADPPRASGALANSLRAGRGKTKAVVRAGNNGSIPYGRVQEYGWKARNIPARMFLNNARASKKTAIERAVENGITQILRKHNLK